MLIQSEIPVFTFLVTFLNAPQFYLYCIYLSSSLSCVSPQPLLDIGLYIFKLTSAIGAQVGWTGCWSHMFIIHEVENRALHTKKGWF